MKWKKTGACGNRFSISSPAFRQDQLAIPASSKAHRFEVMTLGEKGRISTKEHRSRNPGSH